MWEALEVHTEETIAFGREAVKQLGEILTVSQFLLQLFLIDKVFIQEHGNDLTEDGRYENFDFPKLHAHIHVFKDIELKGIIHNYTTQLFERLHGALKLWYQNCTNFKNVAPQVS